MPDVGAGQLLEAATGGGGPENRPRRVGAGSLLARMILARLGLGLVTLFAVSVIIFAAIATLPGDFARSILGQSSTPETVAAFQRELGLDKPPIERYVDWISGVFRGELGTSFASAGSLGGNTRSVASIIGPRLKNTLFLAAATAILAVPLALILGVLSALYRNGLFDRGANLVTLASISVPEFFIAYVLMVYLAVDFRIFPSVATVAPEMGVAERLRLIALPVLTLTLGVLAHMMRMTRTAIINLLASPYIEMARLKGMSRSRVIWRHALPNAWAPIVTVVALNLAYLVVGVVVVEVVFVYPGTGQLMIDAVSSRDVPVVQACALIFASVYIMLNLFADVVSIATNPRLLYAR